MEINIRALFLIFPMVLQYDGYYHNECASLVVVETNLFVLFCCKPQIFLRIPF